MAKEIEIEKKYKVRKIPGNINSYEHKEIEQSYLNRGGSPIRLRKFTKGNESRCVLSKKVRNEEDASIQCTETNIELPEEVYEELLKAKEGRTLKKTRYLIPLADGLKVELDVFHDFLEGVCIAEIEYRSLEQANNYCIPNWLEEITTEAKELSNNYMATQAKDRQEYIEYIVEKREENEIEKE